MAFSECAFFIYIFKLGEGSNVQDKSRNTSFQPPPSENEFMDQVSELDKPFVSPCNLKHLTRIF